MLVFAYINATKHDLIDVMYEDRTFDIFQLRPESINDVVRYIRFIKDNCIVYH